MIIIKSLPVFVEFRGLVPAISNVVVKHGIFMFLVSSVIQGFHSNNVVVASVKKNMNLTKNFWHLLFGLDEH